MNIHDYKGKHVHMVGIGGSSMSGLAEMLLREGYIVSGSDNANSHAVERLRDMGIKVHVGHAAENVPGADVLIFSAAISNENPERREAKRLGIPEMERSTLLGQLMQGHENAVCVCGAHGKTTTSSMIAETYLRCGLDPTVHIGGRLDAIGGGSRIGKKDVFVAEACEFHGSFLEMRPTLAVVLNIDADHLDYYRDIDHIEEAFGEFLSLLPENGMAVGWGEDERIMRLFSRLSCETRTFGLEPTNDYYPVNLAYNDTGCPYYDVAYKGQVIAHLEMKVAGSFNVINSLAAFASAHAMGVEPEKAAQALSQFAGVHRRFEFTGLIDGAKMYHDYGHNPAEMKAALSVARLQKPNHLWAVMQPHTYSRVKSLFNDYLTCTQVADYTLVTDIFAAREKDPGDIKAEMVVEGMKKNGINAVHTPTFDDTEKYLRAHWQPGDLVLTMGCGNINLLNEQMQLHGDTER
ncbi:MAG: UDP-N-acetylmuramate--L-alanine ligase [Clostridiales bacterium]|nr:UDP-N-acetylmuramate--L-alanine ligase [Clostridiales bacterium]